MKIFTTVLLAIAAFSTSAQTTLVPGKSSFEKKWISNSEYKMKWLGIRDTMAIEIGEVSTKILVQNDKLTVITNVAMKNSAEPWADTTTAHISTLKPIYHSSFNRQRNMSINFGPTVTGYYFDKPKNEKTVITETPTRDYFDSNIYPVLIGWLPLTDGFTTNITIFDYAPGGNTGVRDIVVSDVKTSSFLSKKQGLRDVWIVTVVDGKGENASTSIFYFDKQDRTLWKQEIAAGKRNMRMVRVE
jgi:hypothetical protein